MRGKTSAAAFQLYAYDSSGTQIGLAYAIDNASRVLNFSLTPTVAGNTVWHAGNDGSGSGLDADKIDGVQLSGLMQTSWTLTAGNGLTGGGDGSTNRTLTLGTPSTITGSTTNSVTSTSHTHALTLTGTDVNTALGYTAGYKNIPLDTHNAAYTLVAGDAGRGMVHSDTTARAYTVNNSVFAAGDVVTIMNNTGTGSITITQGAGVTLYLAGTTTTGSRTVAVRGIANIFFASASVAYVSGSGVT